MGLELYDFQEAGVKFLRIAGSALLADEMGTGKTVQTIAALEADGAYPALIICPNSVKSVWEREYTRWAPERRVLQAGSGFKAAEAAATAVANGAADVLIVNWEAIRSLSRLAPYGSIRLESCSNCDPTSTRRPALCQREDKILNLVRWSVVVADEVHRAKSPKAIQTRAAWAVAANSERRIALTGTPVVNSAADVWSIMHFVAPDEYPSRGAWINRYAILNPNHFSGSFDVEGLRDDRREELDKYFLPRFLRRTKAQVLPQLPPKVRVRRSVTLHGKQLKAYQQMEKEMVAGVQGGKIVATNVLTAVLRLRQLASAYGEVISTRDWEESDGSWTDVNDKQVVLSEPSTKLDVMDEVLEEVGDKQVVIFAESRQLVELAAARLQAAGHEVGMVTGVVSTKDRAEAIERFQRGELRYILATIATGGEGITLTSADTAIFLQRSWSAAMNRQAEDRLHRIGQEAQSVTYIDLVTEGTVDDRTLVAEMVKLDRLEDVVRDKENA